MILTLDIVSLVLAGLLGMAVGGNNLSACCGPLMGSGMVSRRTGILIAIRLYPRSRVGGTETLPGQRNILANRHCDRNILDPTSFTHSLPRRRTLPDPTVSL